MGGKKLLMKYMNLIRNHFINFNSSINKRLNLYKLPPTPKNQVTLMFKNKILKKYMINFLDIGIREFYSFQYVKFTLFAAITVTLVLSYVGMIRALFHLIKSILLQFKKVLGEMEHAMKKIAQAAEDISHMTSLITCDLPKTLDEIKLATKEFEVLGS